MRVKFTLWLSCATLALISLASAQNNDDLAAYNDRPSRMRGFIERYRQDLGSVERFYSAPTSPARSARLAQLNSDWLSSLRKLQFESLNHDEQVDYLLLQSHLQYQLDELKRVDRQREEMATLLPFAKTISDLEDARRRLETLDPAKTAALLDDLAKRIAAAQKLAEENLRNEKASKVKKTVANRAARTIEQLRNTLKRWNTFYAGYDPQFTWWDAEPYKSVDAALQSYSTFLSDKLVGIKPDDKTTIIGDPIGRTALVDELKHEMIPYSPEELIDIANKEFAWCESEMKKASAELGYGDDWKKALEYVKTTFVEPGKQPALIRDLAYDAIEFVEKNNLVTVPNLARDSWRMEMMTPERQLVSPFFLGGETILVSYPTNTMSHEQKMMSMRGNNPSFSHATVFHELIPGHYLQQFMMERFRPYRTLFYTPFWMEGWSLYWEFLLWDKGFDKKPEEKIGALFWRMHRCARIIFSLSFHLENMTPQECVDLLVEKVGHERENATAEVRRSLSGEYGPLYQIAYMVGGLQFYKLHHDLVDSGKSTDKAFHDAILKEGPIPVEMVRAILTNQPLTRQYKANWRFY